MTRQLDIDRLLADWMSDLPNRLPDRLIDVVVEELDKTPQWKRFELPWRNQMNRGVYTLAGVAGVLVVALVAFGIYSNQLTAGGPPAMPSPSPTAQPTAAPTAAPTATPAPTRTPDAGLPAGPFVVAPPEDGIPGITVIIPASGWNSLPQVDAIEKGTEVANVPEAAILFWPFPAGTEFFVPGDPCRVTSTRPDTPATTVDDFAAALAAQASREATEPADVTVGGYAGKSLTLHVPVDAGFDESFSECERGAFVSYGTEEDDLARTHQGPGQIDELWILDVDGTVFIIDGMYRADTPAELVEEMRAIVESATFEAP